MNTTISYRPTINTAEQVKKAGIFNPLPLAEPCVFIYRVSRWKEEIKDFSTEYFIKKYNYIHKSNRNQESRLLDKIISVKFNGTNLHFIYEHPLATDFYQWNAYRKAKEGGDRKKAREIKDKIILPEENHLIGIGFSTRQANYVAKMIAKRRAHKIAKIINYPILDEIIDISK